MPCRTTAWGGAPVFLLGVQQAPQLLVLLLWEVSEVRVVFRPRDRALQGQQPGLTLSGGSSVAERQE